MYSRTHTHLYQVFTHEKVCSMSGFLLWRNTSELSVSLYYYSRDALKACFYRQTTDTQFDHIKSKQSAAVFSSLRSPLLVLMVVIALEFDTLQ